ncbi:extracellular solute-binding protein [Actinospica durhamensis]|uniref:Extracellular solute-binding protein n=1 Tax=Actinospica durhamensis TaxID=1508375 RepID=A0A941EI29_9ACTN|nr:extracellular solute-binding protein [Actinospica durhamensis]MBR7831766.1 extracellular solute-binding protein [Actinospica durhamensis]
MIATSTRSKRRLLGLSASAAALTLLASACGGTGGGASSGGGSAAPSSFSFLSATENTVDRAVLTSLSKNECATENKALPLSVQTQPQANLNEKVQLLAGQNALPVTFHEDTPTTVVQLAQSGKVENLEPLLQKLGVEDQLLPSAVSTVKELYNGQLDALPAEYNIEGIFYNKQIFAAHGLSVPSTWDELVADAAKLQTAGVQPFSASGQQGWPITRLIGDYIFRDLGPNAMKDVADGKAKLTDPAYVAAAQKVADLGKAGYFGKGVGSIDYNTALNTFLTGKAAMLYMGSWALSNIGDPKQDSVGAANIGFMPFPAVAGGQGSIDQYPSNIGLGIVVSSQYANNTEVDDWLSCVAKNYGTDSLKGQSTISGFKVNTPVPAANAVTTQVQTTMSTATSSVLWFEALFNAQATTTSQQDAAPLVSGSMSAQQFMSAVQNALTSGS